MNRIVFDIETDGLLYDVTKLHCISTYNVDTKEAFRFTNPIEALAYLSGADLLIGHNICTYDLPALRKLFEWEPSCPVFDTLLAGNILFPEEVVSLETWAKKLNLPVQKVQNEDWSVYTDLMGDRCDADVLINVAVYEKLIAHKHIDKITDALLMEQEVAKIHAGQTETGVAVDRGKILKLITGFDKLKEELADTIVSTAPWRCQIHGVAKGKQGEVKRERYKALVLKGGTTYSEPFRKDGRYNANTINYFKEDDGTPNHLHVKGPYTKVSFHPLNLNAPAEVKDLLLDLGWVPTEWNFKVEEDGSWTKKSPKLTEDSYWSLPEGVGQTIARYNTVKHRRSFLQSLKGDGGVLSKIRSDGRVSADAFTCGTPTARYKHSGAVCNIPRITTPFGKGLRGIFGVGEDNWQVGIDLSGIEARMLAHYLLLLDLPEARKTADLILSPDKTNDFHSYNAKVWGCTRDTAKTCLYALVN